MQLSSPETLPQLSFCADSCLRCLVLVVLLGPPLTYHDESRSIPEEAMGPPQGTDRYKDASSSGWAVIPTIGNQGMSVLQQQAGMLEVVQCCLVIKQSHETCFIPFFRLSSTVDDSGSNVMPVLYLPHPLSLSPSFSLSLSLPPPSSLPPSPSLSHPSLSLALSLSLSLVFEINS